MKDLKVLSLFISALMWRQLGDRKSPWENLFVVSSAVISPLVESDAVFTVPSANHWQLHNCCFSLLCFVLSICLLFKPNTPPPPPHSPCSHPSLLCLFVHMNSISTARPSPVVLMDTTAVSGELDWKTYPVNGVSEANQPKLIYFMNS